MLTLGILFGIIAMLGWGVADFFVAKAVRKTSAFKTFLWGQAISLAPFFIIFLLFFKIPVISFNILIITLIAAFLGFIGLMSLYKGLQVGTISIISPIAASSAVVTVILSLIFLKEVLTFAQGIGISLAILGAVLTSFKFNDLIKLNLKNIAAGVEFGVIAMLAFGVSFVFIDVMISELGWFIPMLLIKVLGVLYALAYSGIAKKSISFPKNIIWLLVLIGSLEAAAFLSIGAGMNSEYTSIVIPIASAFPAITIILARIFFKEILELNQKIGIVAVLMGLVLLAM